MFTRLSITVLLTFIFVARLSPTMTMTTAGYPHGISVRYVYLDSNATSNIAIATGGSDSKADEFVSMAPVLRSGFILLCFVVAQVCWCTDVSVLFVRMWRF